MSYELMLGKKRRTVMLSIPEPKGTSVAPPRNQSKRVEPSPYGLPILADSSPPLRMTSFFAFA
jgi:hypothetical protein